MAAKTLTRFGEQLRRYRLAAGLTQEELAERAGVSARGVSDLERGARGLPRKDTLQMLLRALDLAPDDRAILAAAARRAPSTPPSDAAGAPSLPVPPTPLIGRVAEMNRVSDLLRDPAVRLLTLTGPGGTGKTRLALAVAQRLAPLFPDGVIFVPLAPLAEPVLVVAAIAQRLNVREVAGQSLIERLQRHLADKQVLLVLDNFEHLLAAAPFVATILGGCPSLEVLTTSRAPLRLSGEHAYPVPPLAMPDPGQLPPLERLAETEAVRLFVDRVRAGKPDFTLTEANAPAVAEIVHRLDGLPLAMELAAPRVRMLSPPALLARLDRRLPLLTGGGQDLPARQRTLHDTIAWSYDLLTPREQTLFRRLAVFAGGWTLEAAEAVADPDEALDVLETMANLLDMNLIRPADTARGEPRFTMLETIREFAREQLRQDAGEANLIARAHAAWYLALATAVAPRPHVVADPESLDQLSTEYDNLRTALGWFSDRHDAEALARLTGTLTWLWHWTAYGGEGLGWTERALSMRADASPNVRMELLTGAAVFLGRIGDHERATALSEELLTLAQEMHDRDGEASAWFLLSRAVNQRGASAEAMTFAEKAVALFRTSENATWLPWAIRRLGIEAHIAGEHERAAVLYTEALERFRASGNVLGTACALGNLALTRHHLGDRRTAAAHYRESLSLHRDLADPWESVAVLGHLIALIAESGHAEQVARLLGATQGFYQQAGGLLQPYLQELLAPAEAEARNRLGPAAYAAGWDAGQGLSLRQAIEEGLAVVAAIDDDPVLSR